jgi:predicted Zn-dependent peptidase
VAGWRCWVSWVALGACMSCQDSRPAYASGTEETLANGLRLRLVPATTPGECGLLLRVQGAGAFSETAGLPHVARLTGRALLWAKRNDPAERELVKTWVGAESAAPPSSLSFEFQPKSSELRSALGVLANAFFHPDFDPATIERLKSDSRDEVAFLEDGSRQSDSLGPLAWSACKQIAFHSASSVRFKEIAPEVNAAAIASFIRRTFRPERTMLTLVGDFDRAAAKRWVEESFGKPRAAPPPVAESRPRLKAGHIRGSWDVAGHQFFMMWPGAPLADRSYPALELLAAVMSLRFTLSGAATPLLSSDEPGVYLSAVADASGFFVVHAPLRSEKNGRLLAAEVVKMLDVLAKDPLRDLAETKDLIRKSSGTAPRPAADVPLDLRVVDEHWRMEFTLRCGEAPERYLVRLDAVTPDDVHAAIKQYLTPETATIVTIAGKE